MRVRVDEPVGEAGADRGRREQSGQRGDEQVGQFAQGAGGPGVDLEVGGQRGQAGGGGGGEVG